MIINKIYQSHKPHSEQARRHRYIPNLLWRPSLGSRSIFALRPLSECKLVGLPAPELNFLNKVSDPRVHRAYHKQLVRAVLILAFYGTTYMVQSHVGRSRV